MHGTSCIAISRQACHVALLRADRYIDYRLVRTCETSAM
jgi:hypothetical protein